MDPEVISIPRHAHPRAEGDFRAEVHGSFDTFEAHLRDRMKQVEEEIAFVRMAGDELDQAARANAERLQQAHAVLQSLEEAAKALEPLREQREGRLPPKSAAERDAGGCMMLV